MLKYEELNEIIKKYRFVHIIYNDKFCIPAIEFFRNNYPRDEHVFLVQNTLPEFPKPDFDNAYEIEELFGLDFTSNHIEKILMHSLFIKSGFRFWVANQELQAKKAYWIIYGGDLYEAPRDHMADTVRRGFRGYISDIDGDCDRAREKYNLKDKEYYNAAYFFPITIPMMNESLLGKEKKDYIRIQVNNSCNPTTVEMLRVLSKFASENIKINTILSYGNMDEKEEIIRVGRELFGNKFEYLDKLISPAEYSKYLANNDIYILNQDRQQGLGNSLVSLFSGVKFFIKSNVTTYNHYLNKGIKVYDTKSIKDMDYKEFLYQSQEEKDTNNRLIRMFFDDKYLKKLWDPVFD